MEHFRIYDTLDSTNKEAGRLLGSGQYLHGIAILALQQTEGQGQYGRSWYAQPGNHLAMSIILQPEKMLPDELSMLSLKISLAVVRMLNAVTPDIQPLIKWPNDIYLANNKLAGILIENAITSTRVHHSIIGIGININESHFPKELPNPVSLFLAVGKEYEIYPLAKILREQVMIILDQSHDKWKPEYNQYIYGLGEKHEFELDGKKDQQR